MEVGTERVLFLRMHTLRLARSTTPTKSKFSEWLLERVARRVTLSASSASVRSFPTGFFVRNPLAKVVTASSRRERPTGVDWRARTSTTAFSIATSHSTQMETAPLECGDHWLSWRGLTKAMVISDLSRHSIPSVSNTVRCSAGSRASLRETLSGCARLWCPDRLHAIGIEANVA